MSLVNSPWELLRYKVREIGLRGSLKVAYLDCSENIIYRAAKHFPSLAISPRSIQIECTTRCNLKCTMCEISYWSEAGGDVQVGQLQKIIEHLPKLKRVDLTGVGEALMNRGFFEAIELLKSRGLYVTLNDNFTLMTEAAARRIVELGVDQIFLSLDGATKDTYERIRVGANFDKIIANTRRLIEIKREMGRKHPEVKINTVVSSSNYYELPGIVELAHELGVGMVQFVNVIVFDHTTNLGTSVLRERVRGKFQEAQNRARQLGVLIKIELFDKLPVQRCDFPWRRNFVTYDGFVHPCCYTTQAGDRSAQNRRSFGNLIGSSFETIWQSEDYSNFRAKMRDGVLPEPCQHCPKYYGKVDSRAVKLAS